MDTSKLKVLKDQLSKLITKFESFLDSKPKMGKDEVPIPNVKLVYKPDENFVADSRAGNLKRKALGETAYTPQARINLLMTPVGRAKENRAGDLNAGSYACMYNGQNIKLSDDTLSGKFPSGFDSSVLRHEFVHASDANVNPGGFLNLKSLGNSRKFNADVNSSKEERLKSYLKRFLSGYKGSDSEILRDVESYAATGELPDIANWPGAISERYANIYRSIDKK